MFNFIGHALGMFWGCRILLLTSWGFNHQICQLPLCRLGRNAHFNACIQGFVHHIIGEENVTYCWTKFGTSSSKFRPSIYDTNEHVNDYYPKLARLKETNNRKLFIIKQECQPICLSYPNSLKTMHNWIWIPLTGLISQYFSSFPKPVPGFPMPYVIVLFVFHGLRWEVVVCFYLKYILFAN